MLGIVEQARLHRQGHMAACRFSFCASLAFVQAQAPQLLDAYQRRLHLKLERCAQGRLAGRSPACSVATILGCMYVGIGARSDAALEHELLSASLGPRWRI